MPNNNDPIVVDLDETLTPVDTLHEAMIRLIKTNPLVIFHIFLWALKGKAFLKNKVAEHDQIDVTNLPINAALLEYLKQQKTDNKRAIILATASHQNTATAIAKKLDIFDDVIASTPDANIKGAVKLDAIKDKVGESFVYAGDSKADLAVWKDAKAAILVNVPKSLRDKAEALTKIEKEFTSASFFTRLATWIKAIRVHQWLKNSLLFVPILTTFSFDDTSAIANVLIAFCSFSLLASATYIFNDILDLDNDRAHARKRNRPLAAGSISVASGVVCSAIMLAVGLYLSALVSAGFTYALLIYLCITVSYSCFLKRTVLIDVIALSLLYTIRIIAGAVAINEPTSSWLLAFSVFIFLSLALVKRCGELVALAKENKEEIKGRAYKISDLVILWPLGISAAMSSVVVFGLFISAPETVVRYSSPDLLWICAVILTYWLSRIWIVTARGEMHDDPIVFAIKDATSRYTVVSIVVVAIIAHFYHITFTT